MEINPDVSLAEDDIENHTVEQLLEKQHDVDTSVAHSGIEVNDADTRDGPSATDDDSLIKSVGIAHFGVDTTDPDTAALEDAIAKTSNGTLDKGFAPDETDEDAVASALTAGVGRTPSSLSKAAHDDLSALTTEEQAVALVDDVRSNLDLLDKTDAFAESDSPPEQIEQATYDTIYSVVKNYCDTVHSSDDLDESVVNVVADQIADRCGTLARIRP